MSDWISVEDRLPDDNNYVLVTAPSYWGRIFTVAMYNKEFERWIDIHFSKDKYEVTHWMPLPQPPK